jgi:hypothetical protein
MTFTEIEKVLGCELPPSARAHRPWWSNNEGTNVAVRAWRRAGRKTARVDMGGERVVFVKDDDASTRLPAAPPEEALNTPDEITLPLSKLSKVARQLFAAELQAHNGDSVEAVAAMLHRAGMAHTFSIIDEINKRVRPGGPDSVDVIREERDAR